MAGTTHLRKPKKTTRSGKAVLILIAFVIFFGLLTSILLLKTQAVTAADSEKESMSAALVPPFDLPAGLVFNAPDRPLLYGDNADIPLEIPAASRLMTLLISSEKLSADTPINVSKQVEKLASLESNSNFELESGMTLPYHYLILRLLMQNSDAAALAIAEHLYVDEDGFLEIMQQRASELGMVSTEFHTILLSKAERDHQAPAFFTDTEINWGKLTFEDDEELGFQAMTDGQPIPDLVSGSPDAEVFTATSSLHDLSLLAQALNSNRSAIDLLQVVEELVSVNVGDGDRIIPLRSNISRLFTLSEGNIHAAFHHRSDRFSLTLSFGTTDEDIAITSLLLSGNQSPMIDETLKLYDSIDQYFQRTALTEAGDIVPGRSENTESGESFNLQYLDTVYYVHPIDNFYLNDDVIYVGNAPYVLPIQKGSMTGQIIFEMLDGTRIPVRVGPDRDIISSNTILAKLVSQLYNNENLGQMIIGLAVLICLILAVLLIRETMLLFYWQRMRKLERAGHPKK